MVDNKIISVLIPAYNEELLISKVLRAMPAFIDHVIVVDDGSTDNTAQIATSFKAIIISHNGNRGVGASIQTGINAALQLNSDILVGIDADNQFNPADIEQLIAPIIAGAAEFVSASRFKDAKYYPAMPRIKFWGNKVVAFIVSSITNQKFYDVSCGFRAYTKETLLKLNLLGKFTYTHESILLLSFQDVRMLEIPMQVRGTREAGKSKVASNIIGYGFKTLKIILQTYRDYDPFRLFNFIGSCFLVISVLSGIFVAFHFMSTGSFSPYKSMAFLSGGSFVICLMLVLMGFVIESLSLIRRNQDKILYHLKKLNLPRHMDKED